MVCEQVFHKFFPPKSDLEFEIQQLQLAAFYSEINVTKGVITDKS